MIIGVFLYLPVIHFPDQIDVWKPKMEKLQQMCSSILDIEKDAIKARAVDEIQKQIDQVKFKSEIQIDRNEKLLNKKRTRSEIAEKARAEGMSVRGWLTPFIVFHIY